MPVAARELIRSPDCIGITSQTFRMLHLCAIKGFSANIGASASQTPAACADGNQQSAKARTAERVAVLVLAPMIFSIFSFTSIKSYALL